MYEDVLGDPNRARTLALRAREARPADPGIATLLGRIAYRAGDVAWAARLLEESLQRAPNDPVTALYLGKCYLDEDEHTKARDLLERVAELQPPAEVAEAARRALALLPPDSE